MLWYLNYSTKTGTHRRIRSDRYPVLLFRFFRFEIFKYLCRQQLRQSCSATLRAPNNFVIFVCWNPPKWSFSLTARLTQARLHSSLRRRALHGCGCLGAKFQERGAVCVSHALKPIGISEVLELGNQRESPLFPIWNFLVSTRVRRLRHRYS